MLTTSEAAKRVRRSRRTIERWIERGMPTVVHVDEHRRRWHLVEEEVLLAWLRRAIVAERTAPRGARPRHSGGGSLTKHVGGVK